MYIMENLDTSSVTQAKMRGPGVKSDERKAIEALTPGKMVRIPKASAKRGSMGAWAVFVSREKGHKVSVRSAGEDWIVYVEGAA